MSWSFQATATRNGMGDALTVAENACPFSEDVIASREQSSAARIAALLLLDSNAVGGDNREFVVLLSGHGNPGHAPREGWANDTVTITVSQLGVNVPITPQAEAQASAEASNQAPGIRLADPTGGNPPVPANTSDFQRSVQVAGAAAATDQATRDLNAVAAQTGEPLAPTPAVLPHESPAVAPHPFAAEADSAAQMAALDHPTSTSEESTEQPDAAEDDTDNGPGSPAG